MQLAALFLLLYAIVQSLSPAARLHSWDVEYRWNHWIGFIVWLVGTALAHHQLIQRLPDRDPYLFPVIALLSGWGLLAIWRLDWVMGARQTIWLAICLGVLIVGLRIPEPLNFLRRYKYFWLTSALVLTGLTFLLGTYPGGIGPRLWLGCCGVYLQPSEPLKLLLIAYLAAYLADRLPVSFSLAHLLSPTVLLIGAALVLLINQRDLGTASLFILIYTVIVYLASGRWRMLLASLAVLVTAAVAGYMLFDVVRIRVDAWLNPWLDPTGRSYQIVQSLMAVASGGLIGRGPGLGNPGAVPVSHSDFIFASITEETGLAGGVGLILLFALFASRGFLAAMHAPNNYRRFLAAGLTAYLTIQAILIIGGNLRLLPLTGVTLPFVAYGGSSLLTAYVSGLLLLLISATGEEPSAPLPHPQPYFIVAGTLLLGLLALALVTGWWAVARSDTILARTDNPRRSINDLYVQRGSLLDRDNQPISQTSGVPGEYQRNYHYPPLSATTGYNNPVYGQVNLEAALDAYLRGLEGNPSSLIWSYHLLYGQTPPGLDVRLTIDLNLQQQADRLMEGHQGALVLLQADTGEILAMASHPYFDPNQLETRWADLIQDPDAPLINRATQGQYPPGTALGPFLLAYAQSTGSLPQSWDRLFYNSETGRWICAVQPEQRGETGALFASGCPGPLADIGEALGADGLSQLFDNLGFYTAPDLPVEVSEPLPVTITEVGLAAIGQENLVVSPMQMAMAAAALTHNGLRPEPQLADAYLSPTHGWVNLAEPVRQETLLSEGAAQAVQMLSGENASHWQSTGLARSNETELTWFLAGTLPGQDVPLALALVLEENNPGLARQIGENLLQAVQE